MPLQEPIDVKLGDQEDKELKEFVYQQIESLKFSTSKLHKEKLPEWRRIYKGEPRQTVKDFPWPNASNVVIQLAGENTDILKARLIASVYEILPLWTHSTLGEWGAEEESDEQRKAVESFMDYIGLEPAELDLYRVESLCANDIAQYGTVAVKTPWETITEQLVIAPTSDKRGVPVSSDLIKYDGPRPEKLALEDWAATPNATTLERAPFKWHKYFCLKMKLEEKKASGVFTKEAVDSIIEQPDGESLPEEELKKLNTNIDSPQPGKHLAFWEMYECWFPYLINGKTYRMLYTMHLKSKTCMRAVFNPYPGNEEPWDLGRLGYTDDGLYGYGFVEMLKYYQEEVTTGHNQRVDNRTLANTSIALVGDNNKIDSGFSLYPGAVLPFAPDSFAVSQMGAVYPTSVEEERLTIELAKARAGVDQSQQGAGSAVQSKKGGLSAMGTFSTMQAGNSRININITDFRYLHLRLGRRSQQQYAEFGASRLMDRFGLQAKYIQKAFENIKKHRLDIPIKAANASINRALEQQNGMLLSQVMQRHHGMIAQIMQGILNPMMAQAPELKEYLIGTIAASAQLMNRLLRNFNLDDINRLQPELELVKKLRSQNGQQQQNPGSGQGDQRPDSQQPVQSLNEAAQSPQALNVPGGL